MNLAALEELTVRYGKRSVLDRVSLAVSEGSVYVLVGRNGAGKSSLVRCLLGEQRPDSGRALLLGGDAWRERARLLREVGVVPEEPDAPPAMNARQLARFASGLYDFWDGAGLSDRLRRFGVPEDVPFGQLSKGQKGHVLLSLALASSPRLLILDDPTLGLDPVARRAVFDELIVDLSERGTTVFLTSHDLAGVERIADRIGLLRDGRLAVDEEMETLKQRFRRLRVTGAAGPAPEWAPAIEALRPVSARARAWGWEAVVSAWDDDRPPSGLPGEVEVSALTLEEIFLSLAETPR
ncbi:MAG TPA: ABC transporter ATP-binding protein [Thermoanaerobaculia bacterium]|jgi:ABC-2 type transport system ATP-binding protein|nr:ABC transporter ATP-binding protein [Thermoanaerobaculia bacterium]